MSTWVVTSNWVLLIVTLVAVALFAFHKISWFEEVVYFFRERTCGRVYSIKEIESTAIHEAGHIVLLLATNSARFKSAVVRRKGLISHDDMGKVICERPRQPVSRLEAVYHIATMYGGIAGEQVLLACSAGFAGHNDMHEVSDFAHHCVYSWGLNTLSLPIDFETLLRHGVTIGKTNTEQLDEDVLELILDGHKLALSTIERYQAVTRLIAGRLVDLQGKMLTKDDLRGLLVNRADLEVV